MKKDYKLKKHQKNLNTIFLLVFFTYWIVCSTVYGQSYTISTIAGTGTAGNTGDGSASGAAQLSNPYSITFDPSGNLYIADRGNHSIRKITSSTGIITTIAGTGTAGYSGDGSVATSGQLNSPYGIAVDGSGNVYIADQANHRIRKITASTGNITTIAGTGTAGYSGDGSAATSAQLNNPSDITLDPSGNMYIADQANHRIRKITVSTGNISTIAGTGSPGFSGDGGSATSAQLAAPATLTLDVSGNLYISELAGQRIRKITASTAIITTIAGTGNPPGFSGDGGAATSAKLNGPTGLTLDGSGNIYFADLGNHRIRKITVATGIISTIAGTGTSGYSGDGSLASAAQVNAAADVAIDASGNVYIADGSNNRIRKMTPIAVSVSGFNPTSAAAGGSVQITGTGFDLSTGNNNVKFNGIAATVTAATSTTLNVTVPAGSTTGKIAVTVDGNTSTSSTDFTVLPTVPSITSFTPTTGDYGTLVTIAGTDFSSTPTNNTVQINGARATVVSGTTNSLVVAVPANATTGKISVTTNTYTGTSATDFTVTPLIGTSYTISTFAGIGTQGYSGDGGPATAASLYSPSGVTLDASGNLYIVDAGNHVIRKVSTTGNITTIAGTGTAGYSGDGGAATAAQLNNPNGIALDASGNIYIVDSSNNRIRKITSATGIITTIAGTGTAGYSGDGASATSAQVNRPSGVAFDAVGDVYISDSQNHRIRKITVSTGNISTIAGTGIFGFSGDGGPAANAQFTLPAGVIVDASGNIYIADNANMRVRKIAAGTGIITTIAGTGVAGYSGDGGSATTAKLKAPFGLALDGIGNLWIDDSNNSCIRIVSLSTGIIRTIAGTGTAGFNGDGIVSTAAQLNFPFLFALDGSGSAYISDAYNNRIRKLTVNKVFQSITFGSLATNTVGDASFTLSATASSGLPVTYTSSNTSVATVSGNTITIVGGGTTTITASQSGNTSYAAATDVTQTLTVNKLSQTITFSLGSDATKTVGDAAFTLSATATSGLSVTYASSNTAVATISGSTVTIVGAGTTTITASQAGNSSYNAATVVTQTLTVNTATSSSKQNQTITFSLGSNATKTVGDAAFSLSGTASSGLTVSYASSNTSLATISGSTVTIVGAGTTTITASQVGNSTYNAATSVTQTLTVNAATVTAVEDPTIQASNIQVFPNPNSGVLNVSLPEAGFRLASYQLSDLQGKVVLSGTSAVSTFSLNIQGLQNGIYLLQVDNNGQKSVRQVIKE